jgi:anti-sigma B factor antagonist
MAVNRVNGQLKLLNLSKRIRELLAITNLLTIFDTFENEEEAVNSYKTDSHKKMSREFAADKR